MSLAPLPAVGHAPALLPHPARILAVHAELPGTVTMHLDATALPGGGAFVPGQFDMLYAFGVGEVPISFSGDPANARELVHTIRPVGPATRALCALPAGATVGVRGPFGTGWPLDAARGQDVVLIAGGLGMAPLRPAVLHLLRHRRDYGRVILLYGARSPDDLLFASDRAAWATAPGLEFCVTVDHAAPGWTGPVGVPSGLLARLGLDPTRTIAMMCGPEVMMRFTVRELERLGVADTRIYVSMERNMKCAAGFCGHCQYGPVFVCKDGPVFRFDRVAALFAKREV